MGNKEKWVLALAASQIGFMVVAGLLFGLWLDKKMNTPPLFGILGLIAGFGAGIRILVQLVRGNNKNGT